MKVYIIMKEIEDFSEEKYPIKVFDSLPKAETYVEGCLKKDSAWDYEIEEFEVE